MTRSALLLLCVAISSSQAYAQAPNTLTDAERADGWAIEDGTAMRTSGWPSAPNVPTGRSST